MKLKSKQMKFYLDKEELFKPKSLEEIKNDLDKLSNSIGVNRLKKLWSQYFAFKKWEDFVKLKRQQGDFSHSLKNSFNENFNLNERIVDLDELHNKLTTPTKNVKLF